jgi:ElaA protein
MDVRDAAFDELDLRTLYQILALRSQVFVVEQDCVYLDPDGRDVEPTARQLWAEREGTVLATARLLHEADGVVRIGRIATHRHARGEGLAGALVRRALELAGDAAAVLAAQTYLEQWYAGFGFVRTGDDFIEDGIAHLPMRRSGPRILG